MRTVRRRSHLRAAHLRDRRLLGVSVVHLPRAPRGPLRGRARRRTRVRGRTRRRAREGTAREGITRRFGRSRGPRDGFVFLPGVHRAVPRAPEGVRRGVPRRRRPRSGRAGPDQPEPVGAGARVHRRQRQLLPLLRGGRLRPPGDRVRVRARVPPRGGGAPAALRRVPAPNAHGARRVREPETPVRAQRRLAPDSGVLGNRQDDVPAVQRAQARHWFVLTTGLLHQRRRLRRPRVLALLRSRRRGAFGVPGGHSAGRRRDFVKRRAGKQTRRRDLQAEVRVPVRRVQALVRGVGAHRAHHKVLPGRRARVRHGKHAQRRLERGGKQRGVPSTSAPAAGSRWRASPRSRKPRAFRSWSRSCGSGRTGRPYTQRSRAQRSRSCSAGCSCSGTC